MASGSDGPAQLGVQRLDGVRCVDNFADAFGERAFGLLVLLLCLPSMVPGMASVFGLPMLLFGIQMGLGRRKPYLPGWLARRSVRRDDLMRLSAISSGPLKRIERYLRPRPGWFTSPAGEKLVGWLTEWGIEPGPVRPLAVQDVAPLVPVDGPAPELEVELRALHARLHGIEL